MGKRGRKPKILPTEQIDTTESTPTQQRKRGRRSKKQPTIEETIDNEIKKKCDTEVINDSLRTKVVEEISTLKFNESFMSDSDSDSDSDNDNENNYLFELKTIQASSFKSLIEALKEILIEANLEATKNGMRLIAKDENKGIVVFLHLHGSRFEYYKCRSNKIHMGISMINFHKLIKNLNNNSVLTLFIDEDDDNTLGVVMENQENNTVTTYKLRLLDIDVLKTEEAMETHFDSVVYMSSTLFQKLCREMSAIGDNITITANGNELILQCNVREDTGGPSASQETIINESKIHMKFLKTSDQIIEGTYRLKDIITFTKCSNISGGGAMKLYMKNDFPLVIEYNVGGLGTMKLCISPIPEQEK